MTKTAMMNRPMGTRACGNDHGKLSGLAALIESQRSRITGQANHTIKNAATMKSSSDSRREELLQRLRHHSDDYIHAELPA